MSGGQVTQRSVVWRSAGCAVGSLARSMMSANMFSEEQAAVIKEHLASGRSAQLNMHRELARAHSQRQKRLAEAAVAKWKKTVREKKVEEPNYDMEYVVKARS